MYVAVEIGGVNLTENDSIFLEGMRIFGNTSDVPITY